MTIKKMQETLLAARVEKDLRPVQEWLDVSSYLRKCCHLSPKRWRESNERVGWHYCKLCGRTSLDPQRTCWPLLGDRMYRLPEKNRQ